MSLLNFTTEEYETYKQNYFTSKESPKPLVKGPDEIDCGEFWKEASEKFNGHPYCGGVKYDEPLSVKQINYFNQMLMVHTGCLNQLETIYSYSIYLKQELHDLNVLEIGYGLGSLYSIFDREPRFKTNYTGIDVYHHPQSIVPKEKTITYDGKDFSKLPDASNFDFVFCLNVLQHCSKSQIEKMYEYFSKAKCCIVGVQTASNPYSLRKDLLTCGQITELLTFKEHLDIQYKNNMRLLLSTQRQDGYCSFTTASMVK